VTSTIHNQDLILRHVYGSLTHHYGKHFFTLSSICLQIMNKILFKPFQPGLNEGALFKERQQILSQVRELDRLNLFAQLREGGLRCIRFLPVFGEFLFQRHDLLLHKPQQQEQLLFLFHKYRCS
jgi:hypothetical protein